MKPTGNLVSICIPVYNGAFYLEECLISAIEQTFKDVEIILVDDQSTDESLAIAESFASKDSRITIYRNKTNLGLVGNWNECIRLAKGEWIKFLFQDDILELGCIARMVQFIAPDVHLITCDRQFIFEESVESIIKTEYQFDILSPKRVFKIDQPCFIQKEKLIQQVAKTLTGNFIGEPTIAMFRKAIVKELGDFSVNLVQICDFEFWLRIGTNYGLFYIPETLAFFRVHNSSTTANNRETRKELIDSAILIHDLLYAKIYAKFRASTTALTRFKLIKLLKLRLYEAYLLSKENENLNLKAHIDNVLLQYNFFSSITHLSALDKAIFNLMLLRRKIYSIQKKKRHKAYAQL